VKAIVAARVVARAVARATERAGAGNNESELSDLQSSDVELTAPVSPALQLRPKRARKVPARY
jgi:hypothetical protein